MDQSDLQPKYGCKAWTFVKVVSGLFIDLFIGLIAGYYFTGYMVRNSHV
jgi:cytochrome bd-type quinol oxidase subunit 2